MFNYFITLSAADVEVHQDIVHATLYNTTLWP